MHLMHAEPYVPADDQLLHLELPDTSCHEARNNFTTTPIHDTSSCYEHTQHYKHRLWAAQDSACPSEPSYAGDHCCE